jgi:hypothetical protein
MPKAAPSMATFHYLIRMPPRVLATHISAPTIGCKKKINSKIFFEKKEIQKNKNFKKNFQ